MKRIHILICLVLFSLLMTSCREEDPLSAAGDATPVRLCVVAENFVSTDNTTRATEEGYVTKFAAEDKIGIFAVTADGKIWDKNVPYKYNGTTWVPVNAANTVHHYNYVDDVTYFAYYPYSATMDNATSENDIIAAFSPQADQSTYAGYTASDLMTGAGTLSDTGEPRTLTLQLKHRMTLLVLCPDPYVNYRAPAGAGYEYHPESGIKYTVTDAKINNAVAYAVGDNTYRLIVKPATMDVPLEYTLGSTTTSYTFTGLALTAGTYRQFNLGHDASATIVRSLKVGDFYYYDGTNAYLIPGDDTLTPEQQAACIGVVYSTDVNRIGDRAKQVLENQGITTPHGLVMALTKAAGNCNWGVRGKDENTSNSTEPFYQNNSNMKQAYENVDGYGETQWIKANYSITELQNSYPAFYHASRYGTADGGTPQYAAPAKTTGWFIPSMGQWCDIVSSLGGINLDGYKDDMSSPPYGYLYEQDRAFIDNMNKYLNRISGVMPFPIGATVFFVTSSECDSERFCALGVGNSALYLSVGYKNEGSFEVWCCFAF